MELADCYRLLGLRTGASYEDIKSSYRRLARRYHPDANPGNQQYAKEKFIQITEAYRSLINTVPPPTADVKTPTVDFKQARERATADAAKPKPKPPPPPAKPAAQPAANPPAKAATQAVRKAPPIQTSHLSAIDRQLKQGSYEQLQQLLREQRFARAVALVEGLSQRLPNDVEVRQWQAITYQRFGRYLVRTQQFDKAKVYLQKALRTDPHNKSLWYEVERDMRQIEQPEIV